MKLYQLGRKERIGYDETISFTIWANSEAEARKLANDYILIGDEGRIWENSALTTCEEVTPPKEPTILVHSFNAG
jgi:hypothetical protein